MHVVYAHKHQPVNTIYAAKTIHYTNPSKTHQYKLYKSTTQPKISVVLFNEYISMRSFILLHSSLLRLYELANVHTKSKKALEIKMMV